MVPFPRKQNSTLIVEITEKSVFKTLRVPFTRRLDQGFGIVCNAETVTKKVEVCIYFMNFVSSEVGLDSYKSASKLGIYYCCHLGKMQKQRFPFRITEVALATSL